MDSLDAEVKAGRVLYLGASDFPAWVVSACNEYAKAHGKTQFSIIQTMWSAME
jgi:aryl-alcohol dehydrogenase-like predicted oxidoreductase